MSNTVYQTAQELLKRATETVSEYPIATTIGGAVILSISWTVWDFEEWKSFGTGGTPPTWAGYWRMTKFRLHRLMSSDDLRDPSPLSADGPRYLKTALKPREGPRPQIISRTMPQRQRPETIDDQARQRLQSMMRTLAAKHPELLEVKLSKTEGRTTDAIYARPDLATINPQAKSPILDHEIAHAHPSENSLHVWLSDPDARTVIEAGWGRRFPLPFVNSGWIMVYAPRTVEEVELVEGIVRAGIAWITGVEV
jgi:Family of unknown function (DUF5519)